MAAPSGSTPNRLQAQKFVASGVRLGLSGASILEQLQSAGLGYNTQAFYTDFNRIKASGVPRQVPFGSLTNLTNFQGAPVQLLASGPARYQYIFNARIRNTSGQFTGKNITWSFLSTSLLIPDIANGIGIAMTPDVTSERYNQGLDSDVSQISVSDIETYDAPTLLTGE